MAQDVAGESNRPGESIAIDWLANRGDVGKSVRFDAIALVVLGEGRALIRHHINALGAAS